MSSSPPQYHIGQRLSFGSALCTVRYIGPVAGTEKEWLGVEWDDPVRGKHDGSHKGKKYFNCFNLSATAASFVRSSRVPDPELSFVEAVHQKYATDITSQPLFSPLDQQIVISGKVAEEVGFDKIRQQQSQLHELKIVLVDGHRITHAENPGDKSIKDVCPQIVQLDLSRNLFETIEQVADIAAKLDNLRSLRLNGNRFQNLVHQNLSDSHHLENPNISAFSKVTDLEMDEVMSCWAALAAVSSQFLSLKDFSASSNNLTHLDCPLNCNITSLTLEYNLFKSLGDLQVLVDLESLEVLRLKGCQISLTGLNPQVKFGSKLRYLDLSHNSVDSWGFIDDLAKVFPGLQSLRLSHNPIYGNNSKETGSFAGADEAYMITLGRLGNLKSLNFSAITLADRTNAEMFYLSKIAKEMAEVPPDHEINVTSKHRRYKELCEKHGKPSVVRRDKDAIDPNFLEARLIRFQFYLATPGSGSVEAKMIREIPRSFDTYRVKGLVGKMFKLKPLKLRLVWETGEWDPVAGYEEHEEDSEDEDDMEPEPQTQKYSRTTTNGRWRKREVEIEDSTRQIGNCVDGMEAVVRIELRD